MKAKENRYRHTRKSFKPGFKLRGLKLKLSIPWRGLKATAAFVAAIALVLGLSAALAHSYYALEDAPWPRVESIEIKGLKRVDRREVLNALGIARNANVLTLRISQLAGRVEALSWVRSAVVRLDFPSRMIVEVVEREPLAIVYTDAFYLMDGEGKLFLKVNPESHAGLLLVTGVARQEIREGGVLSEEPLEAVKALLLALEKCQSWLPLSLISQCHWQREVGVVLYPSSKVIPIQLGKNDFELKLSRLHKVIDALMNRQWWDLVTRIDLDYKSRAYIKGNFPIPKGI